MIQVDCSCGGTVEVPFDSVGQQVLCPRCQRPVRVISAATPNGSERATGRLVIAEGPENVGEQLLLFGDGPLDVGSVPGNAIVLPGTDVSKTHARMIRTQSGWRIEDPGNSGALIVNGDPTESHELQTGDLLQIGEYEIEYSDQNPAAVRAASATDDGYDFAAESPSPATRAAAVQTFSGPAPSEIAGGVTCPSCRRSLPIGSRICVDCGIDLRTGRALLTSQEVDENALYANTETAIRAISFIVPLGVYPVASEGFGSRKPYVIWIIAALTAIVSLAFWATNLAKPTAERTDLPLMLWAGSLPPAPHTVSLQDMLVPQAQAVGEFHAWQLLTYAFLHHGLFTLAGNLLFLLVLGSRVNALIGPLKTAILYPVLAIAAGLIYRHAELHTPIHPTVGASGAIMGLAGMYLVLLPVHRVHVVAWIRLGLFAGFRLAHNIFPARGFWVVLFYIAFDVVATLLGSDDSLALQAHLGGLLAGIAVALLLLLTRQVNARGGDILSALLGRHAWLLLGKPARRGS